MKVALDPLQLSDRPLADVFRIAHESGYEYLELSQRQDFIPYYKQPRADASRLSEIKASMVAAGVKAAAITTLYRWASIDEEERRAAVRYWKRVVEVGVALDCSVMVSELSGSPHSPEASEAQFWKSMDELLPVFEREGMRLHLECHPDDFIEDGFRAVDLIRALNSPTVKFEYCAPHTFHMGGDIAGVIRYAGPLLAHVHLADSFDHRGAGGWRYIVNPPGTTVRVHQHLNIGEGEVDWDLLFSSLQAVQFDGILTTAVFAWTERAVESAVQMRKTIADYLGRYPLGSHE